MVRRCRAIQAALIWALPAYAMAAPAGEPPVFFGIPVDFLLFAATLLGVALFHHHTLRVAVTGLAAIVAYQFLVTGFRTGPGIDGFVTHLAHEWVILSNLFLLLVGFALLSRHFEESHVPAVLPKFLPDDWKGGFVLLAMIFVSSSFLDNIAAAIIGGTVAATVFRHKVHIGYLAAIVAASNAGGSGSVVGDTTTTMMWIAGVSPFEVFEAYIAAFVALFIFGIPAAIQQHGYSPIQKDPPRGTHVDWSRVFIVALILVAAIAANVTINTSYAAQAGSFPFIGMAVWAAILLAAAWRKPDWKVVPEAIKGSIFLLSLVMCASLMPVEKLPAASWPTALGLGFVSAVFDNIPLTALALKQGGYDWGFLAYAVGFGGSMIWFGSSAGVALSNLFPEAKSVALWLKHSWYIAVAYVIGFFALLVAHDWHPRELPERHSAAPVSHAALMQEFSSAPNRLQCRSPEKSCGAFGPAPALTTHLNQLDADVVGRGNIAKNQARFELPRLHRHAHALLFECCAECPQIASIGETEMIGPPFVVAGVTVESLHGFGRGRLFPGSLATDDDGHAADPDIDLRRAAQVRLYGDDLAAEHFLVPVRGRFRVPADEMNVVERNHFAHTPSPIDCVSDRLMVSPLRKL